VPDTGVKLLNAKCFSDKKGRKVYVAVAVKGEEFSIVIAGDKGDMDVGECMVVDDIGEAVIRYVVDTYKHGVGGAGA